VSALTIMLIESTTIPRVVMNVIPVSGALFDPSRTRRLSRNWTISGAVGMNKTSDKTTLHIARNVKNAG
jgi:hypothetical protein